MPISQTVFFTVLGVAVGFGIETLGVLGAPWIARIIFNQTGFVFDVVSCAPNDFNGHGSGSHQSPHYHFQMRQGNRIVIRYNDFHVPFSDVDILEISAEMASPDLKRRWSHGEGMKDVFLPEIIDALLDSGGFRSTGEGDGDVKFDYLIKADEGTTMKGEDIHALLEEAKASGVSIGTLLRRGKLPNGGDVRFPGARSCRAEVPLRTRGETGARGMTL